jgi:hypothetical protein
MSSLLRLASLACSLVLIASFAMFASDEAGKGSKSTVAQVDAATGGGGPTTAARKQPNIDQPAPSPKVERLRERKHGSFRELVDDGNDILVTPFTGIVASNSIWVQRIAPGLLAFLLFGLGLGFAARYASTRGV